MTRQVGFDLVHSWTLWFGSHPLVLPRWSFLLVVTVGCVGVRCTLPLPYFTYSCFSLLLLRLDLYFCALCFSIWMLSKPGLGCSGPTFLLQVVADFRAGFLGSWLAADSIGAFDWMCCCSSFSNSRGWVVPSLFSFTSQPFFLVQSSSCTFLFFCGTFQLYHSNVVSYCTKEM